MYETGIAVTLEMSLKADQADAFCDQLPAMLLDTRKFPGFRDIEILRQSEDPTKVFFFEHWDNVATYQAYIAWRTERGEMDLMATVLTEPPVIRFWPVRIAHATANVTA